MITYLRIFQGFDFPVSILPKICYRSKIELEIVLKTSKLIAIRRSDFTIEDTFNNIGMLREDALDYKRVPLLSLNLLGGFFFPNHTLFRISNNGLEKWNGVKRILMKDYLGQYSKLEKYCNIYLHANGLDSQNIPYQLSVTKDLQKQVETFFQYIPKPEIAENKFKFYGKTKLLHDPIVLNYWHLELNVFDNFNNPIEITGSKYIKDFCNYVVKDILCANSFSSISSIPKISKDSYIKS